MPASPFARPAFALACMLCLASAPAAPLPSPLAADVQESYRLLLTTYYQPVDPQVLLAAASDALSSMAHRHGVTATPPPLRVEPQDDQTVAGLDAAIAQMAAQAHGTQAEYTYAAIDAMAKAVGDRYTAFFDPKQYKEFNEALDPQQISGIGVMIEPDVRRHSVRIAYVVPETPAEHAGLRAGDVISAIDGTSTEGMSLDTASKMLRGKPATLVKVTIDRANAAVTTYAITREEVQPPTVKFSMLPNAIGYVYVMEFGRTTPAEFDIAISRLKAAGAKALILDLRNDGGGYVNSALDISSRFIANKALLTVEERGHRPETIDADGNPSIALPVTVLVNQYTASASEITAAALQDDGIGILVGTKTFGKGVMQTLTPLADGSAIKITTAHYLTPSHQDINLRGIDPNVQVVENRDARFGELKDDAQLRAAIQLLQKKIARANR